MFCPLNTAHVLAVKNVLVFVHISWGKNEPKMYVILVKGELVRDLGDKCTSGLLDASGTALKPFSTLKHLYIFSTYYLSILCSFIN